MAEELTDAEMERLYAACSTKPAYWACRLEAYRARHRLTRAALAAELGVTERDLLRLGAWLAPLGMEARTFGADREAMRRVLCGE